MQMKMGMSDMDKMRVKAFINQECDASIARHLWPRFASAYFTSSQAELSPLQQTILLAIGTQQKTG